MFLHQPFSKSLSTQQMLNRGSKIKYYELGLSYNFTPNFQQFAWLFRGEKLKFRAISACTAILQISKILNVITQVVSKLFAETKVGIFWELVGVVFMLIPALFQFTLNPTYCSDKQLCLIKVDIHTYCLILTGAGFQSRVESCHSHRQLPSYSRL